MIIREQILSGIGLFMTALFFLAGARSAELREQIYSRQSEFSKLDTGLPPSPIPPKLRES